VGAKASQRRSGRDPKSAGRQRLALIGFALLFALLFIGFAVAQGIGSPSVPSGDVVLVEDVPEDVGSISQEEFDRALAQQAASAKLKEVPKPGDDKYEELKKATLEELVGGIWLKGQAEELGLTATPSEMEKALEEIKKERFPSAEAYAKFLKESKFTQADVDARIELQVLGSEIQEKVAAEAPKPDAAEVKEYYEAEKEAKFTDKETRDVRLILNEDKAEVEAAKKALESDNSPASWKKVATKYSADPSSSKKGGLQPGIQEEFLPPELKGPIFEAEIGELIGPVKLEKNQLLIEVVKTTPAKPKPLKEVEAEIISTLEQEGQQEFFGEFVADYESRWTSRTFCADDFAVIDDCSNFKGSGRPENAPAACYEEDPETPATECPAPVTQTQPALPGTVTLQKPKGEQFAQRPRPPAADPSAEEGTVVPGGGAPPEGAAPPPEGAAPPEGAEAAPPAGE
jgi:parvulin-like peptidyl-prolyl isomerase